MSRLMTMEEWRLVRLFKMQNPEPPFPEEIPPRDFYLNDDYSWDELEPRYIAEGPFLEWRLDAEIQKIEDGFPGLIEIEDHPLFHMEIEAPTIDEFYEEEK